MNENENIGFEDFESAFTGDDGYQTDDAGTGTEEIEAAEDTDEALDQGEDGESDGELAEDEETADEGAEDAPEPAAADTFTLKVNKEEKTYSREEVISLAQKGADYDRVKKQLGDSQTENAALKGQIEQAASDRETVALLQQIAESSGTDIVGLLDNLQIGMVMKQQNVSEDVARERIRADRAERENARLKQAKETVPNPEITAQDRAQREVAEFREAYPDVELTEELVNSMMDDVHAGTSLKAAYEKQQSALKDARIAELEKQLAAEKQNKANRTSSPGSQRDSGGRRGKSDHDSFEQALFG